MRGRDSTPETFSNSTLGPMMDKKPTQGELRFDEEKNRTKLTTVDESRLEHQINKLRKEGNSAQDNAKNGANKSVKESEKDRKKALKQSSFSEKEEKSSLLSFQKGKTKDAKLEKSSEQSENPVEFSRANNKNQRLENPESEIKDDQSFSRKRRHEDDPEETEKHWKALKNDLSESVIPYRRQLAKRMKQKESEPGEVDLKKARKKRDKKVGFCFNHL